MKRRVRVAVLSFIVLGVAACGGSADGDGGTIVEQESTSSGGSSASGSSGESEQSEDDSSGESDLGTRENPAPLGSTARVDDWEVTISGVTFDAAEIIAAENDFNEPAEDGQQFLLWAVSAKYVGTESGDPWLDLSWKVLGSAGNTFDGLENFMGCGVIPDELDDKGETFPGGTVTGNVCVPVDSAQVDGALILVQGLFGDGRTFFALK